MRDFEDYLEKAMDMAEEAGEIAKKAAGEAVEKVKEFTEEGGKAVADALPGVRETAYEASEEPEPALGLLVIVLFGALLLRLCLCGLCLIFFFRLRGSLH